MRKLAIFSMFVVAFFTGADGAVPQQRRTQAANSAAQNTTSTNQKTSARAATSARSGTTVRAASTGATAGAARSATAGRTTVSRGQTATATQSAPTVAARAASTQKVIGSGTKVATATANVVVSEECKQKYNGCMDSFCMLDNASGGRCICSDRNKDLDDILAEIERLDQQSYQMATFGVEQIEMGDSADQVIAKANAVANSMQVQETSKSTKSSRSLLDLSQWDTANDFDDNEIFDVSGIGSEIDGKEGDALHAAAASICSAQIPECNAELSMLKMMYTQQVKSDCTAYENSLKQQKNSSAQKLYAAQSALREAALEQFKSANKYDLGQCTVEFKKCMQTTAGCKEDFTGCVGIAAAENARKSANNNKKLQQYIIKGNTTQISIAASTYDALDSKKPFCESVMNSCVAVRDQVWDTFLREVAPQVKSAELLAESNLRTSCIANISSCIQKACKDTIDPNDPDGSYDLCLSRPDSVKSLCKVELEPCLAATGGEAESPIWDFVIARLASMRVDACTNEVKACLQSDDRCGKDYNQCIGLDLEAVSNMCPVDKLVACQENGVTKSMSEIDDIIQGIYLGLDNAMLTQCQSIVTQKMLDLCGDTQSCELAFEDDNLIGTESLVSYKNSNGDFIIEGLISFGNVKVKQKTASSSESSDDDDNNNSDYTEVNLSNYKIDINDYEDNLKTKDAAAARVVAALQSTANKINQKIAILTNDPQISMCVNGRNLTRITSAKTTRQQTTGRFPHLLDASIMAIMNSGLEQASRNYSQKYNKMVAEAIEEQNDQLKSALCAAMAMNPGSLMECIEEDKEGNCTGGYKEANPFSNMFGTSTAGISSNGDLYTVRQTIDGATIEAQTKAATLGRGEFIQTDQFGNMLGRVEVSSSYSPQTNSCTLTTTTINCDETEQVKTTDNMYIGKAKGYSDGYFGTAQLGFNDLQVSGRKIKRVTITTEKFQGISCKKFAEPVVTSNAIKM